MHRTGLSVTLYEEVYASAQPFEICTRWYAHECRAVEFASCSLCKSDRRLLRPLDAATACDHLMEPQHFAR